MSAQEADADMPLSAGGRRATDSEALIEARLLNAVEKRLTVTRHALREDIQQIQLDVAEAKLQATKEHGEVQVALTELSLTVAPLVELPKRVTELERLQDEESGADKARQVVFRGIIALGGLIVATVGTATGLILAFH